jgi:hypothetical protein
MQPKHVVKKNSHDAAEMIGRELIICAGEDRTKSGAKAENGICHCGPR